MTASPYELIDPRFGSLVDPAAPVEKLASGCIWAEGPAWFGEGQFVVWSDIPNNRMLRYQSTTGVVDIFRQPCGHSNGNSVDRQGRLISCEHSGRRVSRTEADGRIITIADRWNGRRLNSPNDLVEHPDGSIWFTDPTYGIDSDHEGYKADSEIGASNVYRVDAATGEVSAVITDLVRPNGLAFSLDGKRLYVSDTGVSHVPGHPARISVYTLDARGNVGDKRTFADCTAGVFDGFRLDEDGRIWSSAGDGIHCFEPDGTLIGKVRVPEVVANCVFGGADLDVLYICATTSLYRVRLNVRGARIA